MKWHPHLKFAMPGVIALFLAAVLQGFIPPQFRPYIFASVMLTLVLGLVTGQFHRMAQQRKENKPPQDQQQSRPDHEGTPE